MNTSVHQFFQYVVHTQKFLSDEKTYKYLNG